MAIKSFIIPLTNEPIEEFPVALEGLSYRLTKQWMEIPQSWTLDLVGLTNDVLIRQLPLATNVSLLEGQAILELGVLMVIDLEGKNHDPDFDGMGTRFQLFYIPRDQIFEVEEPVFEDPVVPV